jgi:uncharacterized membrane protein YkoI
MKLGGRTLLGAVVVAVALFSVVVGGGLAVAQGNGMSPTDDADDEESIAANNVSLSEEDAIDVATAEANGSVDEVELESEDGTPVYEVELVTENGSETDVAVHANDGTVLETESEAEAEDEDEEMDEDEESIALGNVSLSKQDAIDVATGEVNGAVEEVELESEDGTPAYEVEFADSGDTETEVTVHANDGTVLDIETEDD